MCVKYGMFGVECQLISCCGWKLTISIIMYDYNTYRSLQGYILHVINWLSDNACTERSRVGRGSALQGQSDWEKPLIGVLKSILFKMDTKALFIACWLAVLLDTSVSSLIALGSTRSPPGWLSKELKHFDKVLTEETESLKPLETTKITSRERVPLKSPGTATNRRRAFLETRHAKPTNSSRRFSSTTWKHTETSEQLSNSTESK